MRRKVIAVILLFGVVSTFALEPQRKSWVQVQYVEPSNRALVEVLGGLREAQALEALAAQIDDRFKLPGPLLLSAEGGCVPARYRYRAHFLRGHQYRHYHP
jgi:hypothetical protein